MLIEKEVIRPGNYFYRDEATGEPRKLTVTPELTRYWHEQGNAMLSAGLTVPVPCEHDFEAHPMTPKDKLLNNAGWIGDYKLKEIDDGKGGKIKDVLFSSVNIEDEAIAKKLPRTIRWTSPWINSFTDGNGKEWKNVISHLALTTRPRIINQQPFGSVAAALSMATETRLQTVGVPFPAEGTGAGGFCLSRAGRLDESGLPNYPVAFSLLVAGVPLASAAMDLNGGPPNGKKPRPDARPEGPPQKDKGSNGGGAPGDNPASQGSHADTDTDDDTDPAAPDNTDDLESNDDLDNDGVPDVLQANGDIGMEELLCDLLQALGIPMPDESNEQEFRRHLYEATMSKIKDLTSKGMGKQEQEQNDPAKQPPNQNRPPNQNPNASQPKQPNPLIQQEPQPMFMSLEKINELPEPMRSVALSMHGEVEKLRAENEANKKVTDGLRNKQLAEAGAARHNRMTLIKAMSPTAAAELDALAASPAMALSMDASGVITDPMDATLKVLEKGLASLPQLLTTDAKLLSVHAHPQDADALSPERADELASVMARQMGCTVG